MLLVLGQQEAGPGRACLLLVLALGALLLDGDDVPDGRWVIHTAESVMVTLAAGPGPEHVVSRSPGRCDVHLLGLGKDGHGRR
jgi:hypothetical protein